MKGLGSMKKEFQCLNSSKQTKPTCGRAQKPYLKTIVWCFWKPEDFLKIPYVCKLASKRCFITSQRDWAFDEQVWASSKPPLEIIKHYLQQDKTKLFFEIVFHWHRERFFHLRIAINIWWSLGKPMYYIKN